LNQHVNILRFGHFCSDIKKDIINEIVYVGDNSSELVFSFIKGFALLSFVKFSLYVVASEIYGGT
jgi:hypothetical protein